MILKNILLIYFIITVSLFCQNKNFDIGVHRTGQIPLKEKEIQKIINDLKDLGSTWIRIDVTIDEVLKYKKANDFSLLDNYLNLLNKANLSILINFRGFYRENRYSIKNGYVNSLNLKTFIQRYDFVKYWQLENEVMSKKFWKGSLNDYTNMLNSFYSIVKSSGKDKKVVLAGISSNFLSANSNTISKFRFTLEEYIQKNNNYFDLVDLHLYQDPKDIPNKIATVRKLTVKPIIATEIGGPDSRVTDISSFTEDQYYNDMYSRLNNCYKNNITLVFWHNLNSPHKNSENPWWSHLALEDNGKPNNKYFNLKSMIKNKKKIFLIN